MVALPFAIDGVPFGLGQLVNVGRDTIMFPGSDEMLGEIALGKVPIRPQLTESLHGTHVGHVRSRLDGEICMPQHGRPLVVWI